MLEDDWVNVARRHSSTTQITIRNGDSWGGHNGLIPYKRMNGSGHVQLEDRSEPVCRDERVYQKVVVISILSIAMTTT
jgi:hypothetical protein